jgi:ComF family protein
MRRVPFRELWQSGLELFFPRAELIGTLPPPIQSPLCPQCGEPQPATPVSAYLCSNCADRSWSFEWARAAYPMTDAVQEAILAFKYGQQFHHLNLLVDWLEEGLLRFTAKAEWDALVSVPLHPWRLWQRGFNQSHELAHELSRRQDLPHWCCLSRRRRTSQQARLNRAARLKNLRGAFAIKSRFDVCQKSLLLIDDVFTTGATAEACARVLLENNAKRVAILTLARA